MDDINGAGVGPFADRTSAGGPEEPHFTLSGLLQEAGSAIRTSLPRRLWVEAQVLSAREKPWGWVFELVDAHAEDTSSGAKLTGIMSKRDLSQTSVDFGFEFDPNLLVGNCAILLAKPTFTPRYQLSLKIVGLNPALGSGLLARHTERVRAELQREGIFDAQQRLMRPPDVARVVIIAPHGSAGRGDVEQEVGRWQRLGILKADWIDAAFEGAQAASSLEAALKQTEVLARRGEIDCFLIIRGGGDRAGLAAASSEAVVRAYLAVSVPGIVGVGHARDRSLLDDVAWHSADTPSKALAHLRTLFVRPATAAMRDWETITSRMREIVRHRLKPDLDRAHEALGMAARTLLSAEAAALDSARIVIEHRRAGSVVELRQLSQKLDDQAFALGLDAEAQPLMEAQRLDGTYAGILTDGRARLTTLDDLDPLGRVAESELIGLLARQRDQLEAMLTQAETGLQHVLLRAATNLATTYAQVKAFDVEPLMEWGFALVLRPDHSLVRCAADAAAASNLTLLFKDGEVAVIPRSFNPATVH